MDDLARELFQSLDDDQKQLAEQPAEKLADESCSPRSTPTKPPRSAQPQGVPAAKMTEKQRATLDKLIHAYIDRLPGDVAQTELDRIQQAGTDKVYFAFAGGTGTGPAAHLSPAGADVRGRVPEHPGGQREKPGQPHSQRLAAFAQGFRPGDSAGKTDLPGWGT